MYYDSNKSWEQLNQEVLEQEARERKSRRISCILSMIDSRKQALCMTRDPEIEKSISEQIANLEKEIQEVRNS